MQDHTEFLCGLKRYAKVVGEKDYRKACEAIQAAGYATDPTYANKLVSLIVRHGLTKYDPAATDQEKTDTAATYKVKSGDTLGKIAEEHGTTVADIVAANKAKYPKITADYIQTGWELVISKNETTTHKVKRGDTLGEIAKEHGTTVADIVAANKAKYPKITADYIQTGWTLTV